MNSTNTTSPMLLVILLLLIVVLVALTIPHKEAYDPTQWEDDIAAFELRDVSSAEKLKENPKLSKYPTILFIGSSSIKKWKLDESFPELKTINRGFGGSHLEDIIYYFDRVVTKHGPQAIVIYAGDNDLNYGKSPAIVAADYIKLADLIHHKLPYAKIIYISIKPSLKRWTLIDKIEETNLLIKNQIRRDLDADYLDIVTPMLGLDGKPKKELLHPDRLHLSAVGYDLWTEQLWPFLAEYEVLESEDSEAENSEIKD